MAVLAVLLVLTPAALAAEDFTWSGGGPSSDWSEGANWLGDSAPTAAASIGTLTLPLLPSFQDLENNVSDLSVNQAAVIDSHGYNLDGDTLDLGGGGLSVSNTAEGDVGQFYVFAPLTLSSSQTWQVTGLQDGWWQQIGLVGSLTGENSDLTINLNDPTLFRFGNPPAPEQPPNTANDELGEVTFNGTTYCTRTPVSEVDGHETYSETCYKTEVELYAGALNADDGHALNLHDVGLYDYDTATGPIMATDSDMYLRGASIGPVTAIKSELLTREILTLSSLSLDGGSKLLQRIYSVQGTTPGVDYDQVTSTGTVSLGGATLELTSGGGECPPPIVGQVDTLISTTGSLSGQYGNAPEGRTVTSPPIPGCERTYSYRINYHTSGEPQTVTATALPAVPTNGEAPTIAGTATEGQILTVTHGFWTNQPSSWSDQWQRCDSSGGSCQAIAGATGQSYTLTSADVGSTIRVQETASNAEGTSEPAVSAATAVVKATESNGGTTSTSTGGTSTASTPVAQAATTQPGPTPSPILGQSQTASHISGSVSVRSKGASKFVPLAGATTIPDGSEVEATNGHVHITVATPNGHTQTAEVWGGRFLIEQERTGFGETRFILSLPLTGCSSTVHKHHAGKALASDAGGHPKHSSGPTSRHLWVSEEGGSWGTKGRYVSTSVEGTHWLTLDECTRSTVEVVAGKVRVRDLVNGKTKVLTADQRYTAVAGRR